MENICVLFPPVCTWQSRVRCLGVACRVRKLDLLGDNFSYVHNAWFDSEYIICISTDAFVEFLIFFYVRVNPNPEVFFFTDVDSNPEEVLFRSHAEWRNVLRRCLRCLEIVNFMHELHLASRVHDEGRRSSHR